MTDAVRRRRRPPAWPVVTASLAVFLVGVALLAAQMRHGHDPALGAGAAAGPTRTVVLRRVVVRRVVETPVPREDDGGESVAAAAPAAPAGATATGSAAPASPASAPGPAAPASAPAPVPAPSAPAPAAAPAPAPAAAVATRSS